MTSIDSVTLDVTDPTTAQHFYSRAFRLGELVRLRPVATLPAGFRGFTLSLVVSQPGTVDALLGAALEAGAVSVKPAKKTFWGYGGVVQAPDGSLWKVATSAKKDHGPATTDVDEVVLLLGVDDVKASKRFYSERGLTASRSFGGKYAEFAVSGAGPKLALYPRRALAKDAGVPVDGDAAHGIAIGHADGSFTDPDGFVWENTAA